MGAVRRRRSVIIGFFYHSNRPRRARRVLAVLSGLCAAVAAISGETGNGPPYSPKESMATMEVAPGYRVELVASEPDVTSPVAMDIDENGRLFVVEMPGYPVDVAPSGRVKLLEDADGDGRFERATVFADGLVLPTGVMRWKNGVLVTAAPDVLYLEDTDGDGRADVRRTVLTGFPFTNPQHTVNSPVYGLDNWIYVANQGPAGAVIYQDLFGDRGTAVRFPDGPAGSRIDPPRTTVRFRPDAFLVEAIAGESQFGHTFDAYGRYFGNDNSHHLWHEVIDARYLRRNPHLLVRRAMHDVPDHGAAAAVYPITERPTFELLTEAGEFTSACAPTLDVGASFPREGGASVFIAEPVHNLVHRDVLSRQGATFTAARGEREREFLAARDAWFRPVFLYFGPDGALYVVDYYRPRIEHPEWMASDAQRNPDSLTEGRDRGRIYRIVHESMEGRRQPRLGPASLEALVSALADPNGWWRRTAQRLIVQRREAGAVPLLAAMARERVTPLARLHALWTLHGLGALDAALIAEALDDPDPGLRENAIVLAELDGTIRDLDVRLAGMTADPDARVRFRVLAALGGFETPAAREAHERLLFDSLQDRWMQLAGLSAGSDRALPLIERALTGPDRASTLRGDGGVQFVRLAASAVAAGGRRAEIERVIALVSDPDGDRSPGDARWQSAALEGLADGLDRASASVGAVEAERRRLLDLALGPSAATRRAALRLLALLDDIGTDTAARHAMNAAEHAATEPALDADRRADAVALLALDRSVNLEPLFQSLVDSRQPEAVQVAAVKAFGRTSSAATARFLLSKWAALTPDVRDAAAGVLLRAPAGARLLVDAIRTGVVQRWTLNFWQKRDLLMHRDEGIRAEARALLEEDPRERERTLRRYGAALSGRGDAARGEQVFARACGACHSLGGGAADLGPDLATVRHRPPLLLLTDILVPSRSIAQHYETWSVERVSGRVETGLLAAQTPTTITLRQAPGREITIARDDVRRMTALRESAMPADLDKLVSPEEMAHLLAYIKRPGSREGGP